MKKAFRPIVIASLIAAVLNQALYFVATGFFGVEFVLMADSPSDIPAWAPAVFSVFQGVLGGVVVAWISSRTKSPPNTWLAVSLVALALSFTPGFIATSVTTALWLNAMHVIAGALIIPMVAAVLPGRAAASEA